MGCSLKKMKKFNDLNQQLESGIQKELQFNQPAQQNCIENLKQSYIHYLQTQSNFHQNSELNQMFLCQQFQNKRNKEINKYKTQFIKDLLGEDKECYRLKTDQESQVASCHKLIKTKRNRIQGRVNIF